MEWNNVQGTLEISFDKDEPLRVSFPGMPEEGVLTILFSSTGYNIPARISGPPEDCSPAEYDDERTPYDVAAIYNSDEEPIFYLTMEQTEKVFEEYWQEIDAVEITPDELEGITRTEL